MRRFLHLCLDRTPVIGVLMAALLFRALIPAGFMPTVASDGTIAMELCAGFTTKTVVVHLDAQADHAAHAGHDTSGDGGHDSSHVDMFERSPCGFAVATFAAPPPAMQPALPPVPSQSSVAAFAPSSHSLPSILRSQAPRGPPLA